MKEFIGLFELASFIRAAAFAADMPIPAVVYRAPQPPAPSVFSWIGWYVGGSAGYGRGSRIHLNIATDPSDSPCFAGVASPTGNGLPWLSPNGFIGGQIGYDWQVNSQMGGRSRY
jgi:hypothetical protein